MFLLLKIHNASLAQTVIIDNNLLQGHARMKCHARWLLTICLTDSGNRVSLETLE